ncbi:MAG: hypothetical protein HZC41_09670 [Chloroflexi bacterium]|nr:hypothetical protein [Chloroflexota bacterium]
MRSYYTRMTTSAFPHRLTWRDILAGVLIVLLAFALRVVVVFDRAAGDTAFIPPEGTDQQVYVELAAQYEAGTWPRGVFFWQPGTVYFLVGIRALVGDAIAVMRLAVSVAGALACGFVVAAGWLATRRHWGGYLAGLVLAVYPVTMLFSTEFLSENMATLYIALFVFLALWQRENVKLWRSALLGITLGLLAITRVNLVVLWLAYVLLLLLSARARAVIVHSATALVFMALMIAPVALYNRQAARGGSFPLISQSGSDQIYLANNRDATGVGSRDPATYIVDGDHLDALLYDIRLNPLRFVELQIRKSGLYWTELESGNNLDYLKSGEAVSPLLRAIPLDFRVLSFLGWMGVLAVFYVDRRLSFWFAAVHLLLFVIVIPLWAEGRLKQPSVVPLVLTSACFIVALFDLIRARAWRTMARRYLLPAVSLLLVLAWLRWSVDYLPQTRPVTALPDDIRPLNVVWDRRLELIGWRQLAYWPAAERGWTHFQRSYVVQLYWRVLEPVDENYNFYLAYIVDGERVAAFDRAIGAVSFFPKRTSQWQPGEIYTEIAGFKLPQDSPRERVGEIRLGVYRLEGKDEASREVIPVKAEAVNAESLALQRLAVFDLGYQGMRPEGFGAVRATFGDLFALHKVLLPATATPGDTVTLALHWTALADTPNDYTLFVHVVDADGELVAQVDAQPRNNTLPTSTWPPDYPLIDEISLKLPEQPGVYQVYTGWYDARTFERLPVEDAPDGRLPLGQIEVSG